MDRSTLVDATEREGRALHGAGKLGLDAAVPSCAGWTVADILGHAGRVYTSVAEIIERRAQELPEVEIPKPPAGAAVLDFFEGALDRAVAALRSVDPAEPLSTWSGQSNAGFYHRRMAHETAVHRWDAESAHGVPAPFDAELASDGVDEYLHVVLPFGVQRGKRRLPGGSMHLHRTDGAGEWLVRAVDGSVHTTREHAKGDVAVQGPASDLMLFVWNRNRADTLRFFGDADVAEAWAALAP